MYVLIDKCNADTLSTLVSHALTLLEEHGLNVRCVTCDGTTTNLSTMTRLGCKIGNTLDDLDGTFELNGRKCYFSPDPPHNLKLGRNSLGDMKVFLDDRGQRIEWRFIEELYKE